MVYNSYRSKTTENALVLEINNAKCKNGIIKLKGSLTKDENDKTILDEEERKNRKFGKNTLYNSNVKRNIRT